MRRIVTSLDLKKCPIAGTSRASPAKRSFSRLVASINRSCTSRIYALVTVSSSTLKRVYGEKSKIGHVRLREQLYDDSEPP
jgi:hypothetical protein